MKTKIRRSVFIGLGGTGMRTILYLKKLFIETYGEVPGMIRFLGIDTDTGEFSKPQKVENVADLGNVENGNLYVEGLNHEKTITLEPNEQVRITVANPRALFERRRDLYGFIPEQNIYALQSLTHGAGQVRSNGRFALISNTDTVEHQLQSAINDVKNIQALNNDKYELIDSKIDVYLIFSLGGGTGCGTFIDMAYLVRKNLTSVSCSLAAVAMLPEVFRAQMTNGVERVRSNAYGALKDLDWLMSRTWDSSTFTIPLQDGKKYEIKDRPFDACFLIDNQNRNNDVYKESRQIEEMLALMLITSVGELSTANVSVLDNMAVNITGGNYDVEDKRAWASGIGCCEVLIHSTDLRKMYSHIATQILVSKLLNSAANIQNEVTSWIDSPDVKIREHDADDLTDYLIDINKDIFPMPGIDNDSCADALNIALGYIQSQHKDIDEKLKLKISDVECKLREKVIASLNRGDCGVGGTIDFLSGLRSQIEIYLKEMENEYEQQKQLKTQYESSLEAACAELNDRAKGITSLFRNLDSYKERVCEIATNLARNESEINRKDRAKTFYIKLLQDIAQYQNDVKNISDRLELIKKEQDREIASLRQEIGRDDRMFQINLTSLIEKEMVVNEKEVSTSEFISELETGNKIYDFKDLKAINISVRIYQYVYNLPTAQMYANQDINDVLMSLDRNKLENVLEKMVKKASPLLPHDYLGYRNTTPYINYYVGVNDYLNSVLYQDGYFKKNIDPYSVGDVSFSNIGMKDRIIIFSQMDPMPVFAVSSVSNDCKREYEEKSVSMCFHVDNKILSEMKRTGYSLEPHQNNNTIEFWVKGFIYGLIKRENGVYKYRDEENGDIMFDYWVDLTNDRETSYKKFKDVLGFVEAQFKARVNSVISEKGIPYVTELYKRASTNFNYIEEFACLEYSLDELRTNKHLNELFSLVREEMTYVRKELINEI